MGCIILSIWQCSKGGGWWWKMAKRESRYLFHSSAFPWLAFTKISAFKLGNLSSRVTRPLQPFFSQTIKSRLAPNFLLSFLSFFPILVHGFYAYQWGFVRDCVFASWKLYKTTPCGLRTAWESLEHIHLFWRIFIFIAGGPSWAVVKKTWRRNNNKHHEQTSTITIAGWPFDKRLGWSKLEERKCLEGCDGRIGRCIWWPRWHEIDRNDRHSTLRLWFRYD